ncbi:hypothetical protein ACJDU8_17390 [Clostridium sp. WILCCON 0269]|uniref:Uncharacterized protein n=1 Tax=Candidatus Clostridium eludens TaxID=3381663 RepID=A0ABW8SQ70_9CLOT
MPGENMISDFFIYYVATVFMGIMFIIFIEKINKVIEEGEHEQNNSFERTAS